MSNVKIEGGSFTVKIGGKSIEVTIEDLRNLRDEIDKLIGAKVDKQKVAFPYLPLDSVKPYNDRDWTPMVPRPGEIWCGEYAASRDSEWPSTPGHVEAWNSDWTTAREPVYQSPEAR